MKNVAFFVRVSLAVSEKYPQTKTTPNYSVLQKVQPSDDNMPLESEAYYHLPSLVGYIQGFKGIIHSYDKRVEKGHHRTQKRQIWCVPISQLQTLHNQDN